MEKDMDLLYKILLNRTNIDFCENKDLKYLPVFSKKLNIPAREMVLVLLDIEKAYNITISDKEIDNYSFSTVNKIIEMINNK